MVPSKTWWREGAPRLDADGSIAERSTHFRRRFEPVKTNALRLFDEQEAEQHAAGAGILVHKDTLAFMHAFLAHRREHGSSVEKQLYESMTLDDFLVRLVSKRPLAFLTAQDNFLLRSGERGSGGFEAIGTDAEQPPLVLSDYLSYAEMQVSALLGAGTMTRFINTGDRTNAGRPSQQTPHVDIGFYAGLVGARFERPGLMEAQHILITSPSSPLSSTTRTPESSLCHPWAQFYGYMDGQFPSLAATATATAMPALATFPLGRNCHFNCSVYKRRLRLVIEPFLLEANRRGVRHGRRVYVHAVGLGLGVWAVAVEEQTHLQVEAYHEIFWDHERSGLLRQIAVVDFSYFDPESAPAVHPQGPAFPQWKFSKRNPADAIPSDGSGGPPYLLAAMFAWDSNSYVGNEYWMGMLSASGDPAAAACCTIADLLNPEVNPAFTARVLS